MVVPFKRGEATGPAGHVPWSEAKPLIVAERPCRPSCACVLQGNTIRANSSHVLVASMPGWMDGLVSRGVFVRATALASPHHRRTVHFIFSSLCCIMKETMGNKLPHTIATSAFFSPAHRLWFGSAGGWRAWACPGITLSCGYAAVVALAKSSARNGWGCLLHKPVWLSIHGHPCAHRHPAHPRAHSQTTARFAVGRVGLALLVQERGESPGINQNRKSSLAAWMGLGVSRCMEGETPSNSCGIAARSHAREG